MDVVSRTHRANDTFDTIKHTDVVYEELSDVDKTYVLNYQPKGSDEWKWYGRPCSCVLSA